MACFRCGVCCTEISISSEIPGMENGKPAGVKCIHLLDNNLCRLFGLPDRPQVCSTFQADEMFCGTSAAEALINIRMLEGATSGNA